jgi:predicted NBD/HSP70 family sugar kinase
VTRRRGGPRSGTSTGDVLSLIRDGRATTRGDLVNLTGLARSTMAQHVDALLAQGFVFEAADQASTGGRPPIRLAFNAGAGVVLAADVGATRTSLAVTDLAGVSLAETSAEVDIADGPETVLDWVMDRFADLLAAAERSDADVRAVGIGLPGPVEFASGRPTSPPIMPGWDDFSVPDHVAARHPVPVLVDNDVNIMAIGEHHRAWRSQADDLLFVKVGTGIGCGIVAAGAIHRGADGAAGDIGHIRVSGAGDAICRCGNTGCLEAVAAAPAIASQLGLKAATSRDIVELVRAGNTAATQAVRQAGREIGTVLAAAVSLLNPSVIVVGGSLSQAGDSLLAGIREAIYARSLPLATTDLRVVTSLAGQDAALRGAATLVLQHQLMAS